MTMAARIARAAERADAGQRVGGEGGEGDDAEGGGAGDEERVQQPAAERGLVRRLEDELVVPERRGAAAGRASRSGPRILA